MKYCSSCGNQIDNNIDFCPHCGNRQSVSAPTSHTASPRGKRLHCPKCKEYQLSPIVETDVKSGFAINNAAGKNTSFSSMNFKSIHRDYWMCQCCGNKFRNIQNLESEIAMVTKSMKPCMIFCIIMAVLSLLCIVTDMAFACIISVPFAALMGILHVYYKNQQVKLTKEKNYLSVHCFD